MSDVVHRNILAVLDHSKQNRASVEELQTCVEVLFDQNRMLRESLDHLEVLVKVLQVRVFSGGSTHGNIH